jgi:hypothetical protein
MDIASVEDRAEPHPAAFGKPEVPEVTEAPPSLFSPGEIPVQSSGEGLVLHFRSFHSDPARVRELNDLRSEIEERAGVPLADWRKAVAQLETATKKAADVAVRVDAEVARLTDLRRQAEDDRDDPDLGERLVSIDRLLADAQKELADAEAVPGVLRPVVERRKADAVKAVRAAAVAAVHARRRALLAMLKQGLWEIAQRHGPLLAELQSVHAALYASEQLQPHIYADGAVNRIFNKPPSE